MFTSHIPHISLRAYLGRGAQVAGSSANLDKPEEHDKREESSEVLG